MLGCKCPTLLLILPVPQSTLRRRICRARRLPCVWCDVVHFAICSCVADEATSQNQGVMHCQQYLTTCRLGNVFWPRSTGKQTPSLTKINEKSGSVLWSVSLKRRVAPEAQRARGVFSNGIRAVSRASGDLLAWKDGSAEKPSHTGVFSGQGQRRILKVLGD